MTVAERLGLQLKKERNQYRGNCPSGADGERKFVITPEKGAWYSFAAQKGGDVISLVSFVKGCDLKTAAAWIAGETDVPEKKTVANSEVRESSANTQTDGKPSEGFRPLEYLDPNHEAVIAIGLDPVDAARLGAGYSPRGVLRGTVAIPVRDAAGKLIMYVGCRDVVLPKQLHW